MFFTSDQAEREYVIEVAKAMCVAARTAPKAKGVDKIYTCILSDSDKNTFANNMVSLGEKLSMGFFLRDADNVKESDAIIFIGIKHEDRGLMTSCGSCGYTDCDECNKNGGICAFSPLDLGIAIGSAVSVAADHRVDNRIMFSAGRTAKEMALLPEADFIMGIPLSVSGKSIYFDRKKKV